MPVATFAGNDVDIDTEGFMTDSEQWNEDIGTFLAVQIGIELTDRHWEVIKFMRDDYQEQGTSPTLRRVSVVSGVPTKELFTLFPKKPAKKMAYIAGVPKPQGCV